MLRLLALLLLLPAATLAQDAPRSILVLDGSGSMWGQIDGVNKIVIAREVVAELLETLPAAQELGLMSYGHRRKGDCTDIELIIPPGTDRAGIAAAVNAINPKGKTPLSEAVIRAAEALRYTEEAATVILVSDGIETCDYDPCAVGRELEAAGVGFTAHVIGFDVADPAARAQLQCLAEETGGRFLTADTADELAEALKTTAVAPAPAPAPEPEPEPEPEPAPVAVRFVATDGAGGPAIEAGLIWTITAADGAALLENADAAAPELALGPGAGRAEVLRVADEAVAAAEFAVAEGADGLTVTLVLPPLMPPASLEAPETAPAGSLLPVRWQGPGAARDFLAAAEPGSDEAAYLTFVYAEASEAGTAMLRMPPVPGRYELRYVMAGTGRMLASRPIEVTPLEISLTPPAAAGAGAPVAVGWSGPDYERDYIAVARPGQADSAYETYAYTAGGNPLTLRMPGEAGSYELRYVLGVSGHVAARLAFSVGETATGLTAPDTAPAGATVAVLWTGPDADTDYVSVAPAGADDGAYAAYAYTRNGNPAEVTLPLDPGAYELRYVLGAEGKVLARRPIALTAVTGALEAPASAPAGGELAVDWQGPGYARDYVSIAPAGSGDGDYLGYAYTSNGNPARFQAPTEPGSYELRYVANGVQGDVVLARRPIEIAEVSATLAAPAEAGAGSTLAVDWTGPGGGRDLITVAAPGDDPGRSLSYEYTRNRPAELRLPATPGSYELRYVLAGSPPQVLARAPIEVVDVAARLDAPATAAAGGTLGVGWEGPGQGRDFLSIALPDSPEGRYQSFAYARSGNPATLEVPATPGSYELRYVLDGPDTRRIIARQPLEVR